MRPAPQARPGPGGRGPGRLVAPTAGAYCRTVGVPAGPGATCGWAWVLYVWPGSGSAWRWS